MATTRNQLSYGSQGSDVTELQKLLNNHGYNLDEDGIFGDNTKNAVTDFQQKKGLTVDGIVGTNTWGTLNGTYTPKQNTSTTNTTSSTTGTTADTGFKYDAYQESDLVKQAQTLLQQQMANKPGEYTSPWQSQLNDAINKILNREKFSYDMNADLLYNQYKDQYTTQGKMAMMDTMGQASAMTGGYGNSYAQSVGQQAYQGHLQQLNDKIPELYQLALNQYQMEGDEMYDQLAVLGAQEEQDYGRHRDTVSDYNVELDRLLNQYNTERDYDYSKWADGRDFAYGQYSDDRAYDYQVGRDQVADSQWQAEFNEAVRQWNKQWNAAHPASSSSGGYYVAPTTNNNPTPKPQEQPKEDTGSTSGFTGSTYSEAVAYMKDQGVSGASAAGIKTSSEFKRSESSREFNSYNEYLNYIVDVKISEKK